MPIYEYQCTDCGHEFEALQKLSDEPLISCPSCDQAKLKKKVSAAAFRLSGSGWYETDFKSKNKKNLAGNDAKTDQSGDKADNKNTDKASKSTDKSSKPSNGQAGTAKAKSD